ncbi:MAG: type II toxin-antitoxin system VapC family toxin [Nitrospira sp.]|nr:MAG: type II toxin-antitoxin system VapC family toxin [Nitrospira sp.]
MALPNLVFCDTSFFYACLDPRDTNHARAQALVTESASIGATFCTTWDIISETVTLLRYRRNYRAALAFLTDVKPGLRIVTYGDRVRDEAEQIFRTYARDHRLSFCDAISFVVVTSLLDHLPCFTFDEDFRALGLTVLP